jgi:hypothetical protein
MIPVKGELMPPDEMRAQKAVPPQMMQVVGTAKSSADAPEPGDVSGLKELEQNRGKQPDKEMMKKAIVVSFSKLQQIFYGLWSR